MIDLNKKWVARARYWKPLDGGKVRCELCYKKCPIASGGYGACGVRYNEGGVLYTLVYGLLTAVNLDPIEKKPLMHFMPGSSVISISTAGCNFMCMFCQNWTISQSRREGVFGDYYPPEGIVSISKRYGADGISYTYNEPTIFYEYMYDVARLAKKEGMFNTMVTNGYMGDEALMELSPYMDAATVDFKGGGNLTFYRKFMGVPDPEPIFTSLKIMKSRGVFVEVTNLVVPKHGDDPKDVRKLARWICENLGPETPFHLLRFYPHYMMSEVPPTPVKVLEGLAKVALEEGLKHIYLGNVPGHELEHTYCPNCNHLLVRRYGFDIAEWNLREGNICPNCGYRVNIVGSFKGKARRFMWW